MSKRLAEMQPPGRAVTKPEQERYEMKLLIGENIKRLRRERDLTQEEVAAHLGISFQAISKWERGDGYPDITMLPSLANYFGVSVDELIGMNEIARAEKYEEINRLWEENNLKGLHLENIGLMRDSLKAFPNNALLLVQLSTSLEKAGGTEEEKAKYLKESIAVQEQILRYGEDSEVQNAVRYNVCFSYWKNGEYDKALEQAKKLPSLYKARENAVVYFLRGQERWEAAREALKPLAWSLSLQLSVLAEADGGAGYIDKVRQILNLMFDQADDDFVGSILERLKTKNVL